MNLYLAYFVPRTAFPAPSGVASMTTILLDREMANRLVSTLINGLMECQWYLGVYTSCIWDESITTLKLGGLSKLISICLFNVQNYVPWYMSGIYRTNGVMQAWSVIGYLRKISFSEYRPIHYPYLCTMHIRVKRIHTVPYTYWVRESYSDWLFLDQGWRP